VPFIWTSLHTYGGNLGIKGNISRINDIPFAAPPLAPSPAGYDPRTQAVGVGYTPEGLDQNTVRRQAHQCLSLFCFMAD
jgi:hypothetical protein